MKLVAVVTEDFRLYHQLVKALKESGVPFTTLMPSDEMPQDVCAVFTSLAEQQSISHPRVVAVEDNLRLAVYQARHALWEKERSNQLVLGVDPGPRPGVAVLGDGCVLATAQLESPEEIVCLVQDALTAFPSDSVLVRVGHGNAVMRNRIINSLRPLGLGLEIVDEAGTSLSHSRDNVHVDAAVSIALSKGRSGFGDEELPVEPSPGEIREVQRRSRDASGGRFTLDRESARLVAMGEKTLEDAIGEQDDAGRDEGK